MRKFRLSLLLTVLMSMVGTTASAHDFEVDGIYYNVNESEQSSVYVTSAPNYYSNEVIIPESVEYNGKTYSVTRIEGRAFFCCSGLTSVTIPNSVTSIGNDAFAYCSGLTSIKVESGNTVYESRNNCNAIIKTATNELIAGCKNTVIPNSVTSIGGSAFYGCSGLTSIDIPNSVTSIGSQAFYGCSGLKSIVFPCVTSIGSQAFYHCNFESITLGGSITSIDDYAFWGGCKIQHLIVEKDTPINIKPEVFQDFSGVLFVPDKAAYMAADEWKKFNVIVEVKDMHQPITFDEAETKNLCVANWDANGDGELSQIEAAIVNSLGSVFNGSAITSFNELLYFKSLMSIGDRAFYNCSGLTSVTIPSSVTSIGEYAFRSCSGLTSVTIPNSVTSIGHHAFSGCIGLTSVTIPSSVTSIGNYAFYYCLGLTSVTIPNSVTSIGGGTFYFCI